jgi:large subunit ribosomal protein L7/L12
LPVKQVKETKTEFDVILKSFGPKKLEVVRTVKELTSLGLRESMELVTNLGAVKKEVSKDEADMLKAKLEEAGAEVELK